MILALLAILASDPLPIANVGVYQFGNETGALVRLKARPERESMTLTMFAPPGWIIVDTVASEGDTFHPEEPGTPYVCKLRKLPAKQVVIFVYLKRLRKDEPLETAKGLQAWLD